MFEIVDEKRDGAVIKVIGVGGCGGNAVEHMIHKGVAGVEFIAANTDAQVLDRNPAPKRIPLGAELTQGLQRIVGFAELAVLGGQAAEEVAGFPDFIAHTDQILHVVLDVG